MPGRFVTGWNSLIRRLADGARDDRGGAAISFILALPIFLIVIAIILQYALLANARIMVQAAAHRAARTAVTCLPEQHYDNIKRAAEITLAPVSPDKGTVDPEGTTVSDAFQANGVPVSDSFAARYSYAMAATTVTWPDRDYQHLSAQEVDVTVTYRFCLSIPGAMALIGQQDTVGGVTGRFFTLGATVKAETAHSRQSTADATGWPSGGQQGGSP